MAFLRIDHNKTKPLLLDDKDLSYGTVQFNPRKTFRTNLDHYEYLQIAFQNDHDSRHETTIQINTDEIIRLHNVIETFLLPRIREQNQPPKRDTATL